MSETTFRLNDTSGSAGLHGPSCPSFPAATPLTSTVPKEFVHRAAVAEVLLTGWRRVDATHFTVTAQWPRLHGFYSAVLGRHDPLLTAETIRQAGALLSHAEFGVPLGHQFLMRDLSFTVDPRHLAVTGVPADLELEIRCSDIRRRGSELASMRYEAVLHRDGQIVATGGASFACASPAVYRRVRGERAGTKSSAHRPPMGPPVPPPDVGRAAASDVVLSPTDDAHVWRLRTDTTHPVLFDHPVDHIPGMLLVEAARQAALVTLGSGDHVLTSFTSSFDLFAELDLPCRVEAGILPEDFAGHSSVLVTGRQGDAQVFSCVVNAPRDQGLSG
ncbi:ScbA/BarX family gamma-butyrolactone biosynthesis protein [Streptomyces liangshanensis]|uniref:ScbA/BarX family gamma-butyrolactone biosynthesis protein n=1 Tax=Streptomyces liangshanensis TaxID=2717324 RepID=UPI0036DCF530